ncbi:MAG: CBS domain-containing protein [Coriobacteriia bacterium]|nr:CBS domain-containing protein [Coriobacteriia bacterium]
MQIVVGHANPDFDAYAATVAATKLFPGSKGVFLGTQNANVRTFHNLHEDFLDFADLRGLDLSSVKRLIIVDTRDADRIGEFRNVALDPDVEVVVYDHHPPAEGDLTGVDDRSLQVGATTSILVHEIRRRGIALTPLEASVLLLGIHEDTGSLTYPGSTAYDAEAASYLMSSGADMEVLNQFLSRALDEQQRRLLDELTASLELWSIRGQEIAVGTAQAEEYVDSASVLTHYIVEDMGYRVAIALVGMPERIQVVARSRLHEVDVGAVMGHLGGGGHAQAASAAMRGLSVNDALGRVREALEAEVRAPLAAEDIMSSPVRTVTPDVTMSEAGEMMTTWGHGGLPVVENGVLAGLVTRKDYDKAHRHELDHAPVRGFMARDIITVLPDTLLVDLERLLARQGIGRVPVLVDGAVVGIVTRKDLLRAEHGEEYLDRRIPRARAASSERFLSSLESLLPPDARDALRRLGELAEADGLVAHVVGGFVRDMLLGKKNLDMDVVVEGDAVAFAQKAADELSARVKFHRRFGTAILVLSRTLHVDVTSARTEYYTRPGALPTVERSSLRQDLLRRDFSVNAMAACINPERFGAIADPFGGLKDLERGVLKVLHSLSFVEDPTRVLRAARFEERYAFEMDSSTEQLARQAVEMNLLDEVSGARIREEMLDIIDEDSPAAVFERLQKLGALGLLLYPSAHPHEVLEALYASERGYKTLAPHFVRAPRRRVALVAALAHGATRSQAERWLRHLRFGREYGEPTMAVAERAPQLFRTLRDGRKMRDSRLYHALKAYPEEAMVHLWSMGDERVRDRVELFLDTISRLRPEVGGEDLIGMGLEPSPVFSSILSQALDDRLDGRAVGREAELANLKRLVAKSAKAPSSRRKKDPNG